MATYTITAPDGKTWEVTAPDNASEEQVLAFAKKQFADSPAAKPEVYNPTQGMSGMQRVMAGYGKAASDLLRGGKQLLDIPAAALERKFGRIPFGPSAVESAEETARDIKESARLDQPLMGTASGFFGNLAGNIVNTLPAIAFPWANTVKGGAAIGAGMGALSPTETDAGKIGMALGGAVAGAAVPAGVNLLKGAGALVSPMTEAGRANIEGRVLRDLVGKDWKDVAKRMEVATALVPGSVPTAGQVAESGGVSALERAMTQAYPEAFAKRAQEQALARSAALRTIAGAPGELDQAMARRAAIGNKLYGKAVAQGIDDDMAAALLPQIESLMGRPSMKKAIARAGEIFGEQDIARAASGDVRALQLVKQAMDDVIEKSGSPASSIGKNELNALRQTRADLISVMQDLSPALRTADVRYAKASMPINRMEVGQELVQKLEPALRDYGGPAREMSNAYAQALRQGDRLATNTLGRQTRLADLMGPERMGTLESIAADLGRKANAADLGRGTGSNTFQNLAMGNLLTQSGVHGLPNLLSRPVQIGEYALRGVYNRADKAMQEDLMRAVLAPETLSRLMMMTAPSDTRLLLSDLVKRGATSGAIGLVPSAYAVE